MGKQSIGTLAYNQFNRFDTLLYLMVYPQQPLVKTKTIELIKFDKLPAGQNAIVAVMSYSGYDIEDALVINKVTHETAKASRPRGDEPNSRARRPRSRALCVPAHIVARALCACMCVFVVFQAGLDRGFGRSQVMRKYSTVVKKYPNQSFDRIVAPGQNSAGSKYEALEEDGICRVGELIQPNNVYINKQTPLNTNSTLQDVGAIADAGYKSAPMIYRAPCAGYADKVLLTNNADSQVLIKVLMRSTRRPEIGDKFSRHVLLPPAHPMQQRS